MAKNILLVKTSSLGDVIHVLPAINDMRSVRAAEQVDWVVEESLAAVPCMHSGVTNVIPIAIRRWRHALWQARVRSEIAECLHRIREQSYDAVIDAQGLFKSAVVAFAARGKRYGFDFQSSREPLALIYHRTFRISWQLHAVERNRLLLARSLGYEVPQSCNYGISTVPRNFDWLAAGSYAVLLHATSGDYKLWNEKNWVKLGNALRSAGIVCVLPGGSAHERERAERIGAQVPGAIVPPASSLEDLAALFAGAQAVVGVDTGLTHLAAALAVPTVGIYCGTDPAATGIWACARAQNVGGINRPPEVKDVMSAIEHLI